MKRRNENKVIVLFGKKNTNGKQKKTRHLSDFGFFSFGKTILGAPTNQKKRKKVEEHMKNMKKN